MHAYLADLLVGYKPHQRLDSLLEAELLEEAVNKSYARAARSLEYVGGISVSGQRVLSFVRKLQPEELELEEELEFKKVARVLNIEADEDHVAHREKGVPA